MKIYEYFYIKNIDIYAMDMVDILINKNQRKSKCDKYMY